MMTMTSSRERGSFRLVVVAAVMAVAVSLTCTTAELIYVGGKEGWAPNVNYTVWASHRHFHVDDWLFFRFDKSLYNVLEVNKTNYENCKDSEFLSNITKGGRDVFKLTEARPYYFLSSGGYCYQGMKLGISVEALSPPPASPPANDASATSSASLFVLPMSMLATIMVWFQ